MSDEKPREFWICDFSTGKRQVSEVEITHNTDFFGPSDYYTPIKAIAIRHVIEHSAYTAVIKERDELKERLKHLQSGSDEFMQVLKNRENQNVELRESLKLAVEALEKIRQAQTGLTVEEGISSEALTKIKAKHGDL